MIENRKLKQPLSASWTKPGKLSVELNGDTKDGKTFFDKFVIVLLYCDTKGPK